MAFEKTVAPDQGAYLLQDVEQLVQRLGQHVEVYGNGSSDWLEYNDGSTIELAHEKVMGILNH